LTKVCPFAADIHTTGLFNFDDTSKSSTFTNLVAGGPSGVLMNLPGYTLQHVGGPPGCAGGGLQTPIPFHATTCTHCGQTYPLPCSQAGYAIIPSWSGTKLKQGSIDLWVKFDAAGSGDQGIVSRDATSNKQPGHFSIYRHADGFIAVRLQKPSANDQLVCSKPVLNDTWYHVGVNFGPAGLELYLYGQRVAEMLSVGSETCGDGKDRDIGLDGNDEPWVVGGSSWHSCEGVHEPVTNMLSGTVANLRISSVRRDFSTMFK
jgi:hypothetical protein